MKNLFIFLAFMVSTLAGAKIPEVCNTLDDPWLIETTTMQAKDIDWIGLGTNLYLRKQTFEITYAGRVGPNRVFDIFAE